MANLNQISNELDNMSAAQSFLCAPEECTELVPMLNKNLKIIHTNIRSINKNLDQFLTMISTTKIDFDVLILTECWLQVSGPVPILQGYASFATINNVLQNDGVVIYVRETLKCVTSEPLFLDANCIVTCIGSTAIISIYRSPSFQNLENFYNSLQSVVSSLQSHANIILIGDINVDIKSGSNDRHAGDYLTLTASLGLLPAHSLPTRLNNCLDHIMLRSKKTSTVLVLDSHVTDHQPTCLFLLLNSRSGLNGQRTKTQYDYEAIRKELNSADFSPILICKNANQAADLLINSIQHVISNHTRITGNKKCKVLKPWMTTGLVRCLRNRDRMHSEVRKNPEDTILKISYTRYRNFCNTLIKKLRRAFEKQEFQKAKNNPKATWKVIKSITNTSTQTRSPRELLSDSADVKTSANQVNQFFTNIGKNLADKITANITTPPEVPQFNQLPNSLVILPVDEEQVGRIIHDLRSDCATGWDNIPARVIKNSCIALIPAITHICNLSIDSGTFPEAFKKAVVHPIYKSGGRDRVSNYRPISVLSSLSKILERILNNCLIGFLEKHKVIANNQYGFRSGISTEDAVTDFSNSLVGKLDNNLNCYGIFLDLTKAFDTVSVPRLISKMENLGVRGVAHKLFTDYLSDRTQCVTIDSVTSSYDKLTFGIPQGSILGPTLFVLYINDLCKLSISNCEIFCYADDTALLVYDKNWAQAKDRAEYALRLIMKWLSTNLLTLNLEKTKSIRFCRPRSVTPPSSSNTIKAHACCPHQSVNCNCITLSMVSNIKYLGVIIDQNLNWCAHIEALCARIRRLIYMFKELRHSADSETLILAYLSLCQSIVTYCIPVWGGTFKTAMIPVERAQRAVLKVMLFKTRDYPTDNLYSEAKVLTVRKLYILRSTLRKHSTLPIDKKLLKRRQGFPICNTIPCRHAFASRQFLAQSSRIYNTINKTINLYRHNSHEIKNKLSKWLQPLTYDEVENILKINS